MGALTVRGFGGWELVVAWRTRKAYQGPERRALPRDGGREVGRAVCELVASVGALALSLSTVGVMLAAWGGVS